MLLVISGKPDGQDNVKQILFMNNTNTINQRHYANGSWSNWAEIPNSIPDVSGKVNCVYTSWGTSLTFTPRNSGNCHALVCSEGAFTLLWIVDGGVHIYNISGTSNITASRGSDGRVTVTRSTASTLTVYY